MKRYVPLILIIIALILLAGCCLPWRPGQRPSRKNIAQGPPPEIPAEINRGKNKEPVLRVYIAEKGTVEEMGMEEYIMGVVAGEMGPDWPENALAAQAIITRTFTLQKIVETGGVEGRDAHASTDIEEFQAYNMDKITDNIQNAVKGTRGKVVTHQNAFIRGWFSAFAGPRTALADEGLDFEEGNPPYIHSVENPGNKIVSNKEAYWQAFFRLSEVCEAIKEATGQDPGTIEDIGIKEYGPSGRATVFQVNDTIKVPAPGFRIALGSTRMRSTYVDELKIEGDGLIMKGVGYGHGVGMCQWGARALAEKGWKPEEIVNYFYRDVGFVKLW